MSTVPQADRSPRTSLSSAGGEDSEFVTARTVAEEGEAVTTERLTSEVNYSSSSNDERDAFYSTRDEAGHAGSVPMPFITSPVGVPVSRARISGSGVPPTLPSGASAYSITFDPVQASRHVRASGAASDTSTGYRAGYVDHSATDGSTSGWEAEAESGVEYTHGYDYAAAGYDVGDGDAGAYGYAYAGYDVAAYGGAVADGGGGDGDGGGGDDADKFPVSADSVADIFSMTRHNRAREVLDLLERGVNPNIADAFGNTVLSIACQNGLKRIAKGALRKGADINYRNVRDWGGCPRGGHPQLPALLNRRCAVQFSHKRFCCFVDNSVGRVWRVWG